MNGKVALIAGRLIHPRTVPIIVRFTDTIPNRDLYRSQSCIRLSRKALSASVLLRSCHSFHFGTTVWSASPSLRDISAVVSVASLPAFGVRFAFASKKLEKEGETCP